MNVRRSSGATEGRSALARRCSSYTVPFHPFQLRRVSFEDAHHGGASAVAQTSAFSFECGSRNAPPTLVYRFPRSGPSISARPSCGRVAPCILSRLFFFRELLVHPTAGTATSGILGCRSSLLRKRERNETRAARLVPGFCSL